MRIRRRAAGITGSVLALTLLQATFFAAVAAADVNNANHPDYWEALYPDAVECYYHTGDSAHGSIVTDDAGDEAVQLNVFQDAWPGDHWEVLIVKGGAEDVGDGRGNAVYDHPAAGTSYYPPLNGGEQQPDVSHWIVCKGEDTNVDPDPDPVQATLLVKKVVVDDPDEEGSEFDFVETNSKAAEDEDFDLEDGDVEDFTYLLDDETDTVTVGVVEEAAGEGWSTSVTCYEGNEQGAVVYGPAGLVEGLVLGAGEEVLCVFTNTHTASTPTPTPTPTPTNTPPVDSTVVEAIAYDHVPEVGAEVLGVVISNEPPEVAAAELPFTGFESGNYATAGLAAAMAGALLLAMARRRGRHERIEGLLSRF